MEFTHCAQHENHYRQYKGTNGGVYSGHSVDKGMRDTGHRDDMMSGFVKYNIKDPFFMHTEISTFRECLRKNIYRRSYFQ